MGLGLDTQIIDDEDFKNFLVQKEYEKHILQNLFLFSRIEMDAFMHAETPFERYVYFLAFKHDHSATQEYLEFFNDYCETTPTWTGPNGDNTDVLHPGM